MNYEYVIKELSTYTNLLKEIENISELISRIESTRELKAIRYDIERVTGSSSNNDLSTPLARVECIKDMYNKQVNDNLKYMQDIDYKISTIDNSSFRNILRMKYIQRNKLEYIATVLNVSFRHAKRLHKKAIYSYLEIIRRSEKDSI